MSDIKEMFIEKLKATKWMDESVIELAIEKVHKIVQKIGYPTKVRSYTSLTCSNANLFVEPEYNGPTEPS